MRRPSSRCPSRRIHWIPRMHFSNLTHSNHLINRTIPCLIQDLQHLRTRACQILLRILHISLIIPCRQHHAVCCQTVQWTLHYRDKPGGGDAAPKRQKPSISSSSGLNRLGGDVSLPSQSQSSQPILPTVVVPSPPAILTNKKKQPAVRQRSRRLYSSKQQSVKASSTSALIGKKRKEATAKQLECK